VNIRICAKNYPSPARPHQGTFLYALVQELASLGASVSVTSPQPLSMGRTRLRPATYGPEVAPVDRPRFVSCSVGKVGPLRLGRLTSRSFRASADRSVRASGEVPDLFYGHFLFMGGDAAVELGRRYGRPSVIALGESDITRYEDWLGLDRVTAVVHGAAGVLCVSPTLRDYCISVLGVPTPRLLLAPNGVDCRRFAPHPRRLVRERLGFPLDRPIISFVGHFNDRKGPDRVLKAAELSRHAPLTIFLGHGTVRPSGPGVLHVGAVPHSTVALYLSASDLFVLPTLAEGSCNSILEALACGIPVVSSDIASVREDIGAHPPVFLCDPLDVDALTAQIDAVLDLDRASAVELGISARLIAEARDLRLRAVRIHDWLGGFCESGVVSPCSS
jgi:teichuronic acid biosynthesis glycosyltransferase TuaC